MSYELIVRWWVSRKNTVKARGKYFNQRKEIREWEILFHKIMLINTFLTELLTSRYPVISFFLKFLSFYCKFSYLETYQNFPRNFLLGKLRNKVTMISNRHGKVTFITTLFCKTFTGLQLNRFVVHYWFFAGIYRINVQDFEIVFNSIDLFLNVICFLAFGI